MQALCCFTDNFSKHEIGSTILDVVLEAGDLLYFPRGTIHQVPHKDVDVCVG